MQLPEFKNFIDGVWQTPAVALNQPLHNANTAEVIGEQLSSDEAQVNNAINSAYKAFHRGSWSELPYNERADHLEKIAEKLVEKAENIAQVDALQTGVTLSLTEKFSTVCSLAFKAAASHLRSLWPEEHLHGEHGNEIIVERLPLGVAAIIAPWNAPSGIACHKLASALAAGCTVVFKPSEWASGSAQYIAQAIVEAGLPDGVFQFVHGGGHVGSLLTSADQVAAVSFTGGAVGGQAVGQSCGANIKPAQLELGGNNALVVLESANLDATADSIITGLTTMNAQWCRAIGRLVVDEKILPELLDKVRERFAKITLGSSLTPDSQMGPLVHQGHLAHIQTRVAEYQSLGGELIQHTKLPELAGWFYPPTLITGLSPEQTLEEVFGPVATVHSFNSEQQAVAIANGTAYGLAAYVFGDEESAWPIARKLTAGVVKINDVSLFALRPDLPRAAWGKSGLGDEGLKETFEFFRGTRVVGVA
ncbi:aldehyde dehydrogenase family protein [Colwellia sp. MEBiC06753]